MYVDLNAVLAAMKEKQVLKLDITIEDEEGEAVIMSSHDFSPSNAEELVDEMSAKFEDLTSLLYLKLEEEVD